MSDWRSWGWHIAIPFLFLPVGGACSLGGFILLFQGHTQDGVESLAIGLPMLVVTAAVLFFA